MVRLTAEQLALLARFTLLIERGEIYLIASVVELPGCFTQAESIEELFFNAEEAIRAYLG